MKTFLILSDTHGNIADLNKLKGIMSECDYIIHLGDYQSDMRTFSLEFADKIYSVKGNCDGGGIDLILEVENKRILMTHGDRYGVKSGLYKLTLKAKEVKADIVLFGHTHTPFNQEIDGITFINSGTMGRYGEKTYCYMVIAGEKVVSKIVSVE